MYIHIYIYACTYTCIYIYIYTYFTYSYVWRFPDIEVPRNHPFLLGSPPSDKAPKSASTPARFESLACPPGQVGLTIKI